MKNYKYNNPQQTFNYHINKGRLSINPLVYNYAGIYMYMYTDNGKDYFKNIITREYFEFPQADLTLDNNAKEID